VRTQNEGDVTSVRYVKMLCSVFVPLSTLNVLWILRLPVNRGNTTISRVLRKGIKPSNSRSQSLCLVY